MLKFIKKTITNVLDWFLYTVLTEKQKEKLANLFPDRFKEKIKGFTQYGKKHSQKLKVKQIKDHLYTLGFTELALNELHELHQNETDPYMKRLVAWELTLWYANQYTKAGAEQALRYIGDAAHGEKNREQLRRIAIIEAECLARIGNSETAYALLKERIEIREHPDLYLAIANLEENVEERLSWINKAYRHYGLNPIAFSSLDSPTYDELQMEKHEKKIVEQPKVSVILPAYNAESGIRIAVESILAQTWENLELLIVDDCSTDGTLEVIEQYAKQDERVKCFQTPKNSGPYVARNIALAAASGDFVTVNDADDWSHEKKIEIQVRHLLDNPTIIANSSEHARLTEELYLYRRGTPGRYIFPNMSSIMFRKKEVQAKLGFWDSVRFAADGEFKRRLIREFGKERFIDLPSGPLSLPRQSVSSLTSSSAFGYNGFFMGVRKEYVESLEYYHKKHKDLFFPFPQTTRPFPVPEPMWPERETKDKGARKFDVVIAGDFRALEQDALEIKEIKHRMVSTKDGRIGLVQLYRYDLELPLDIAPTVRELIDGDRLQMLVYGEKIATEKLIVMDYNVVGHEQKYIPQINPKEVNIIVKEYVEAFDETAEKMLEIFGDTVTFFPLDEQVRKKLPQKQKKSLISKEDWVLTR